MKSRKIIQVVILTPEFLKQAKTCMTDARIHFFIQYLGANPLKGGLVTGTRLRKLFFQGKDEKIRIIYYFQSQQQPIYLFTIYQKNQKANLSQSERELLNTIIRRLAKNYGESYMSGVGKSLIKGAMEALEYEQGQTKGHQTQRISVSSQINVVEIRSKLNMTQLQFCETFGFNLTMLDKWEKGEAFPDAALTSYLTVISQYPNLVLHSLK